MSSTQALWRSFARRSRLLSWRSWRVGPLAVDEQGEAVLEVELVDVGAVELLGEGAGHAEELHGLELVEGRVVEHEGSPGVQW